MGKEALEALIATLDNWSALFTLLVVIGVGGELAVHIMQSRASKRLIAIQNQESLAQEAEIARVKRDSASFELDISKANRGAAEALERAAKAEENLANAKKDAAEANERAAEANRVAEGERLERLKLEASLKPRRLTAEQKDQFTSLLKKFGGRPIDLEWVAAGGQETADLASDMFDCITKAGINIPQRNILADVYFKGVRIKFGSEREAEVQAIAGFFIEAGLSAKPVNAESNPNSQSLAIVIGSKP